MVTEIKALENIKNRGNAITVFLAGGCSTADWRRKVTDDIIRDLSFTNTLKKVKKPIYIINPVNDNYEETFEEQTKWEYENLDKCDILAFWFTPDTLCPTSLYELGRYGTSDPDKLLTIGIAPGYEKKDMIIKQVELSREDVTITEDLNELSFKIIELIYNL